MNAARVAAVARKEFLHVRRDPRSLAMAIAIPMLLLLLFGYALTIDVDKVPLAVWDQSDTPQSRELVARFDGSRYFDVSLRAGAYPDIERAIALREVIGALVVPRDFAARIATGLAAPVQFFVDGSDSNTATFALGYAETVARSWSREVVVRQAGLSGAGRPAEPLEVRPRAWFNENLGSKNFIVPGLIAVIMMVIAALLTSLTVAREWEQGTMEQLVATPVRPAELVVGKLVPYFVLGMLDVLVAVGMGELLFRVPLRGSVALLFALSAVFLVGALSMGMLISIMARSQPLATELAMGLTFLPAFLLSGFVYAIGNMPAPLRMASHVVPSRYVIAILKGIYLKGVGLPVLAAEAALLSAFGAGTVLLATRKLRKTLA